MRLIRLQGARAAFRSQHTLQHLEPDGAGLLELYWRFAESSKC